MPIKSIFRLFSFIFFAFIFNVRLTYAQCCAAGSGSPIAGGGSVGVLVKRQVELNSNFQYLYSDKFLSGTKKDTNFIDYFKSKYLYTRVGVGITERLTLSVESGYFINKTQQGLKGRDTLVNSGIGDLIVFPRFDAYNKTGEKTQTSLTVGLGVKIPVGRYSDSLKFIEPFSGMTYKLLMPPVMQNTSGSMDLITYAMFYKGFIDSQWKFFTTATYIRKGYNPLGEKFGDYVSLGLFTAKIIRSRYGLMAQIKGEHLYPTKVNKNLFDMGFYNYDVEATGFTKILFVPQVTYIYKSFSIYLLSELPLYQNMNKLQIASHYQLTGGATYRFLVKKKKQD